MEARKMLPERQLLRLHRHAQEQDAGDLRRAAAADGRQGQAPALPQLHDEAGDRGGLHPRRAQELHAGRQLLQAGQDDRGRPGVRHQEGAEEAAPLRREPRPRDPAQGRDHGRPLPRAGAGAEQDRRPGAGDGGHQRHRAGDPVLPRHQGVPARSARARIEAIVAFSGEHEYGGAEGHRGVAQRLSEQARSPTRSRRTRTAS